MLPRVKMRPQIFGSAGESPKVETFEHLQNYSKSEEVKAQEEKRKPRSSRSLAGEDLEGRNL
jgi:hypothetical protein